MKEMAMVPCRASIAWIPNRAKSRLVGFTLVEILVVIAIIGLLIALLLPAIQSSREASRVVTCKSNLRQLSLAATNYSGAKNRLPTLWSGEGEVPWECYSWRVSLLPYLEQSAVFKKIEQQQPPLAEVNLPSASTIIEVFQCPSTPGSPRIAEVLGAGPAQKTNLQVATNDYNAVHDVSGLDFEAPFRGLWNGGPRLTGTDGVAVPGDRLSAALRRMVPRLSRVRDGLSHTVMLVEQAGKPQAYGPNYTLKDLPPTEGAWITADYGSFYGEGVNVANYTDPYGFHGKAIAALGDGAVVDLNTGISPEVLIALLSRQGNEILDRDDWAQ